MSREETGLTRLVVADDHRGAWIEEVRTQSRPGDVWHILLLRVSAPAFERRHASALASLPGSVCVLDVAALARDAVPEVGPFVRDLVWRLPASVLGGATLGARLEEQDGNLWWSLEVSEKSPFRGRLIERLYQLALIRRAVTATRYDEVRLRISDASLVPVLEAGANVPPVHAGVRPAAPRHSAAAFAAGYWTRALAMLGRFAAVRLLIRAGGWPVVLPARGGIGVFTMFPYWWLQPYAADASDRFFSAPPDGTHYVAWLTWPRRLWRHRRELRAAAATLRILPLQRFVVGRDAVRLLSPLRFARILRAWRSLDGLSVPHFGSFDVSALVAGEVRASMADAELFFDQLIASGVRRYAASRAPGTLLYRVEGQPWENALVSAARRTATTTVGFFHSPFGENYPALRFAPGELASGGQGAGPRPRPDGMLVCGPRVRRHLEADGFSAARTACCGPQRHGGFVRFLASRASREDLRDRLGMPRDEFVCFVALAIVPDETEGLFACLASSVASGRFRLVVKTHPNRPEGDASLQAAVRSIGPERVDYVPAAAGMYEYLAAADVMICIGSTVAFEAMALDVMPVVYEHPGTFPATSLRAFDDALYVVSSADDMRKALEESRLNEPGAAARRGRFARTVDDVLGNLRAPLEGQLTHALAALGSPAPAPVSTP